MKKNFALLLLGLTIIPFASGCGETHFVKLTYGNKIPISREESERKVIRDFEITTSTFETMMNNEENFLLFTYYSFDDEVSCGCLSTSGSIMRQLSNKYNYKFYSLVTGNLEDNYLKEKLGFGKADTQHARITLFEGKNRRAAFSYDSKDDYPLYGDVDRFNQAILKYAKAPSLFYVDQDYLDTNVVGKENNESIVMYVWNSCDDCKFLLPNKVIPFIYKNEIKDIFVLDLDEVAHRDFSGEYAQILAKYYVSDRGETIYHKNFGYDRGFVPTTQYWKNGILTDATVYFNDDYALVPGSNDYEIIRSFYSQERASKLSYLDNVEVKVLQGKRFGNSSMEKTEIKNELIKMHDPLFNAFMNKYIKK